MRDSNTNLKKRNAKKDSVIFDVVEFGSSTRVSVLYNFLHSDNTGYFSMVDNTPKSPESKKRQGSRKGGA